MKGDSAMAGKYDTSTYKKLLLHFMGEADPLYSMLQWLTERMMEVEAEMKAGGGIRKRYPCLSGAPFKNAVMRSIAREFWRKKRWPPSNNSRRECGICLWMASRLATGAMPS